MIYLSLLLSAVCIIIFTTQFILTLRSSLENFLRYNLAAYYTVLLIWQAAGFGILFTRNIQTAELMYKLYTAAATGFIFTALPLSFAITGHKKKKTAAFWSLVFYAVNFGLNIAFDTTEPLNIGNGGFYVPAGSNENIFLNLPSLVFLILAVIYAVLFTKKSASAMIRQKMYYFLTANLLIFSGLASNLTVLKDYPVDILCATIGGLLLSYAVLQKRLLNFRKTFFRGAFYSTLVAGASGIFLLLLYLISIISGYEIPYYTIIPAILTFLFILAGYSRQLKTMNNILFPVNSIYVQNIEKYKDITGKLLSFDALFKEFYKMLSNDFDIERLSVHLLDTTEGELELIYSHPDNQILNIKKKIRKKSPLMLSLKYNDILILDEFCEDNSIDQIPCSLKEIYGVSRPDLILPVKLSGEVIGAIIIKIRNIQHYVDKEDITYIMGLNRLTTDAVTRGYAYEQLEREVFKKENLIKDINHRVKNNLQMISGLLTLQSLSAGNAEVVSALNTAEHRIQTIAKIHEMLYIRGVIDTVNLKTYIGEVLKGFHTSTDKKGIYFETEIEDIEVESEKALTICLVVNELLANAFKYAYPEKKSGAIKIIIRKKDGHTVHCLISDSGIGCREPADGSSTGIGHNLVNSFINKQLKGSWKISCVDGTEHQLLIPLD